MARPVYCGNFEYGMRESEIEDLFDRYGRVERVDMKTGTLGTGRDGTEPVAEMLGLLMGEVGESGGTYLFAAIVDISTRSRCFSVIPSVLKREINIFLRLYGKRSSLKTIVG